MLCYCFLKNVVDLMCNDENAYKRRFNMDYVGPLIPFGAEVTWQPITDKDKARCHQLGSKTLSGIFIGYGQKGNCSWNGELVVADWDKIENAERFSEIHPKIFKPTRSSLLCLVSCLGFL